MIEADNVLKLFFTLRMQRYSLSGRFLAFISLVSYCCGVSISSATILACQYYQNHCTSLNKTKKLFESVKHALLQKSFKDLVLAPHTHTLNSFFSPLYGENQFK